MGSSRITVGLADDHHLVRAAFRLLVETEADIEVVGEASDGRAAIRLADERRPDVLVLDLMLPGMGGLCVVRRLSKDVPETRVVMLSMHGNRAYVSEALRNGALGYVLKNAKRGELIDAIRHAAGGRRFLCSALAELAVDSLAEQGAQEDPLASLTDREHEVIHLVASGLTTAQVADQLFISPRTAEKHRARAMTKLGLQSPYDLAAFAIARGLLASDSDDEPR